MSDRVAGEDYSGINEFLARYFRYVDENKPDDWAGLWIEDGVFAMEGSNPLVGREALKAIPGLSFERSGGKMRHLYTNLSCEYGESRDTVIADFYELVLNWQSGGALQGFANCKALVVRDASGWKMKRNEVTMLR
jgi:hypothetical protein